MGLKLRPIKKTPTKSVIGEEDVPFYGFRVSARFTRMEGSGDDRREIVTTPTWDISPTNINGYPETKRYEEFYHRKLTMMAMRLIVDEAMTTRRDFHEFLVHKSTAYDDGCFLVPDIHIFEKCCQANLKLADEVGINVGDAIHDSIYMGIVIDKHPFQYGLVKDYILRPEDTKFDILQSSCLTVTRLPLPISENPGKTDIRWNTVIENNVGGRVCITGTVIER